jgi:two-component system sensor histidine kinase QseC
MCCQIVSYKCGQLPPLQLIAKNLTSAVIIRQEKLAKCYRIEVSDNGIGIPGSAKARIYDRFFRADNAIKTYGDSTGLGLYLVKKIAQISGGRT